MHVLERIGFRPWIADQIQCAAYALKAAAIGSHSSGCDAVWRQQRFLHFLLSLLRSLAAVSAENLFLRKQLAFYRNGRLSPDA